MRGEQFAAEVGSLLQSPFPSANFASQFISFSKQVLWNTDFFDFNVCVLCIANFFVTARHSPMNGIHLTLASLASFSYLTTLAGNAFDAERAKSPCRGTSREGALALTLTEHWSRVKACEFRVQRCVHERESERCWKAAALARQLQKRPVDQFQEQDSPEGDQNCSFAGLSFFPVLQVVLHVVLLVACLLVNLLHWFCLAVQRKQLRINLMLASVRWVCMLKV